MSTERYTRSQGDIEESLQTLAEVRNCNADDLRTIWSTQNELCDWIENSDYYYYRLIKQGSTHDYPHICRATTDVFYHHITKSIVGFQKAQGILLTEGREVVGQKANLDEILHKGKVFLNCGYNVVDGYLTFLATPAESPQNYRYLNGVQKAQVREVVNDIGTEKPENFKETLRRYIPRWMSYPIPSPIDHIDAVDGAIEKLWYSYSPAEAHSLVHPDNISQGMPLHLVFKTAKMVEKAGNRDLGYFFRIWGITQVLKMEKECLENESNPEIPFFWFTLANLISKDKPLSNSRTFFDYQSAINETMELTFGKLSDKQALSGDYLAVAFLQKLADHYQDIFPAIISRSIINHSNNNDQIDQLAILRGISNLDFEWVKKCLTHIDCAPSRRVLTMDETLDIAGLFTDKLAEDKVDMADFLEDIKETIGDEDDYSFKIPSTKLGLALETAKIVLDVDLDASSEMISLNLDIKNDQQHRILPLTIGLSGELESLQIETLGNEPIDGQTALTFRKLLARAIKDRANKLRVKPQPNNIEYTQQLDTEITTKAFRSPTLTREERKKSYEQRQQEQVSSIEQVKKRQLSMMVPVEPEIAQSNGSYSPELERLVSSRAIIGLDKEKVEKYLKEGNLHHFKAEDVIRRLQKALYIANINGNMLGKKVDRDQVNLRQINWNINGQAIRLYLQVMGDGQFLLCGILNKKGSSMQNKYIDNLVQKLLREGQEKDLLYA